MFKEQMIKFKDKLFKQEEGNNKKKIESLVVFVIILIVTIIIINTIWNSDKEENIEKTNTNKTLAIKNENNYTTNNVENIQNDEIRLLEIRLKEILNKITGVGEVDVLITSSQSSQTVAMYNEDNSSSDTEESDKNGGNRKVSESNIKKEVIYQEINGQKVPVTQSIIKPKIEGAIITAKGAGDINVKTSIIQAVEAATGLATHKIQVFQMNV